MKKTLLCAISAVLAFTSCQKYDDLTPTVGGEVTFTSSINSAATRVTDASFEEGDAIGVFAKSGDAYTSENVKYDYVDGVFTSSDAISSNGDALSFVAIYPYTADAALQGTLSVATDQSSAEAYEASDILSAVTSATSESCPALSFYHSLSAVEINIISEKAVSAVAVNAAVSVEYDLEAGEFASSGSVVAVTPLSTSSTSYIAVVSPQSLATGSQFVDVTIGGEVVSCYLSSDVELASGYKYVCNVTVTDNDVYFSGDIAPWTEGDDIDGEIVTDNGEEVPEGYTPIYSAEDLAKINDSAETLAGSYYLMNDIDLKGSASNPWTPIGTSRSEFTGVFDGGNHLISGLYVDLADDSYVGLFAYTYNAEISNVGVDGVVTGYDCVGAIVGCNDHSVVSNCYSSAEINGYYYMGGIVGDNYGSTVINCYNTGDVISLDYAVGGVVGNCYESLVINCYNTGKVSGIYGSIGGVVGVNDDSELINCYNSGDLSGDYEVGGVSGYNYSSSVTNCYSRSGCILSGGGEGNNGEEVSQSDMQGDSFVITLNNGAVSYNQTATGDKACAWVAVSGTYPTLDFDAEPTEQAEPEPEDGIFPGQGTLASPYQIDSVEDMLLIAEYVNGGESFTGIYFEMTCDIDLKGSASNPWTPIGGSSFLFSGNFDGGNHLISGLYIDSSSDYAGLFGYVEYATISNLGVGGVVKCSMDYVGAIAGCVEYTTLTNCYSSASVTGDDCAGGLLGANDKSSQVVDCYNTGDVYATNYYAGGIVGFNLSSSVSGCYNTADIYSANGYSGGIVGRSYDADVENCYNTGVISTPGTRAGGIVGGNNLGSIVDNSYNVGAISATEGKVGGIVGANTYESEVNNSYTLEGSVVSDSDGDDGTVKSQSDMKDAYTVILLNASQSPKPWVADDYTVNSGYPVLSWQ